MKLFDSHLHIIDPRFPLTPNNGFLPAPFSCEDYLARMHHYDLRGGAIVSGSFQGFDQTYLLDALEKLGPEFVGVTNLPVSATDENILDLAKTGIRAVRFNLKRGGSETLDHIETMASRVYELCGWHVELYVGADDLETLYKRLINLPSLSIDHLGLSKNGFKTLLNLVEKGVHIKATGFGRVDFDVPTALQEIHAVNPHALMFGTDLPSTRAPRPYRDEDFQLVIETFGEQVAQDIFYNNAIAFYKK